ncbi:class I SAM-dependent methyltransferase [Mycobacterium sp. URHB0021]|jgi:O-methyltransferase involved in polyketide biosynthesis
MADRTGFLQIDGDVLDGVSATTLWTLHSRGTEAKRSDGVIRDPWALGEGLQTSFWRLDRTGIANELTWYSVDSPPVMALRDRLLPKDGRIVALAQSALDRSWMDRVDPTNGVFITAEGLRMHLRPDDVLNLIRYCAARFGGGQMMFDSVPHWFSRRTVKGYTPSDRHTAPPMPFGLSADEGVALAGRIPGVAVARDIAAPSARGLFKVNTWPPLDRIGLFRRIRPSLTLLEFVR